MGKSIKEMSDDYFKSVKDKTVLCVYDRFAGSVDGAEQVLDKFEKKFESAKLYSDMSVHSFFYRDIQELIKELKGGKE